MWVVDGAHRPTSPWFAPFCDFISGNSRRQMRAVTNEPTALIGSGGVTAAPRVTGALRRLHQEAEALKEAPQRRRALGRPLRWKRACCRGPTVWRMRREASQHGGEFGIIRHHACSSHPNTTREPPARTDHRHTRRSLAREAERHLLRHGSLHSGHACLCRKAVVMHSRQNLSVNGVRVPSCVALRLSCQWWLRERRESSVVFCVAAHQLSAVVENTRESSGLSCQWWLREREFRRVLRYG